MFTGTWKPSSCYQHNASYFTRFEIASSNSTKIRKSPLERSDSDASLVFFLYSSLSNDRVYLYTRISLKKLKR